jgi:hypothetical protein
LFYADWFIAYRDKEVADICFVRFRAALQLPKAVKKLRRQVGRVSHANGVWRSPGVGLAPRCGVAQIWLLLS